MQTYAFVSDNVVVKVEECSEESYAEQSKDYNNIVDVTDFSPMPQVGWLLHGNALVPAAALSQSQKDTAKFLKRAKVRDQIIAEMATENIARVYAGVWTEQHLVALSSDVQLNEILANISALAYEIAYAKVSFISNPLITEDIKAGWKAKLAIHFFN